MQPSFKVSHNAIKVDAVQEPPIDAVAACPEVEARRSRRLRRHVPHSARLCRRRRHSLGVNNLYVSPANIQRRQKLVCVPQGGISGSMSLDKLWAALLVPSSLSGRRQALEPLWRIITDAPISRIKGDLRTLRGQRLRSGWAHCCAGGGGGEPLKLGYDRYMGRRAPLPLCSTCFIDH